MCLYPKTIENRKYRANKKNGGNIPPVNDNRIRWVNVGCEQCIECRKQKARNWQVRLLEDIKTNTNGKFITLTFSNEAIKELNHEKIQIEPRITKKTCLPARVYLQRKYYKIKLTPIKIEDLSGYEKDNAIATLAIRRFLERWRKKYKKSVRHWMITEIGHKGTENIHLHGIIWTNETGEEIENIWKYGFIWKGHKRFGKYINYVNGSTINYTIKYFTKIDKDHKTYKPIILTSPGIGNKYNGKYNKYKGTETNETYRTSTGHTIAMPAYWRNKIYTEEEKEKLWIQKLDKQEKWIDGQKIDISKGYEKHDKLLEIARQKNKDLGYGDNNKDEKRAKYERERRTIIQEARIKNASGGVFKRERINKKAACGAIQNKNKNVDN